MANPASVQSGPTNRSQLLELLKFEVSFLEHGGYGRSVRTPWKPTRIFLDSPTCLEFYAFASAHPHAGCLLMNFVPAEYRSDPAPCHHIPLNEAGDTLDSLNRRGNEDELQEMFSRWLRRTIEELEKYQSQPPPSLESGPQEAP